MDSFNYSTESYEDDSNFNRLLDVNIRDYIEQTAAKVNLLKQERDFVFNKIQDQATQLFKG